jgi:hypothetical protein
VIRIEFHGGVEERDISKWFLNALGLKEFVPNDAK